MKDENKATVTILLTEIETEICEKYCKYPDICRSERKDPDEAEDLLYREYCSGCPMNKI